jgi:mono/diheme cytochrome c family protein
MHGEQYLDPKRQHEASTYYGETSGVAIALNHLPKAPRRVAVVGLGTGTIAAWGRAGDVFRFYELNPEVPRIARSEFTYLDGSAAKTEVVLGDARLSMEREAPQGYDLIAIDAFSSDAIPVHLMTREAMAVYLKALQPPTTERPPVPPRSSAASTGPGARLYDQHCAGCHGDQGEGVPGVYPALAGNRAVVMHTPANAVHLVLEGGFPPATAGNPRPYGMPPFATVLSTDEVAQLLTHIRSSWGNQGTAVSALDVTRYRGVSAR